jgi:signal transduction histidine kinase
VRANDESTSLWRRGLSLELKLPLAVSAVLTAVLLLYFWIAYTDVTNTSIMATSERAGRLAVEISRFTAFANTQRSAFLSRVANQPQVKSTLRGGPLSEAEAALAPLRVQPDSALAIVLMDSLRRPMAYIGPPPSMEALGRLGPLLELSEKRDTIAASGPFFVESNQAIYWSAAAVRDDNRIIGYVAKLRRIATAEPTARAFRRLIGEEGTVFFANSEQPGGPWFTVDGEVVPGPTRLRTENGTTLHERSDAWQIARRDAVGGTPFTIIVETPVSHARARAAQFLQRTGLLSLLLLVAGTLIIWLLSRSYTWPIRELNKATAAVAERNYARRVPVERSDELGELAIAFNHMASEIQRYLHEAEVNKGEAERANRAKSEFLANMSHEIRTPINAMLGYADLMEMGIDGPLSEKQRAHLQRIRLSGQHLVSLIDDLLDFARLETARISVEHLTAPAADAVETALTVIDPQAAAKNVELQVNVEPNALYVGDPRRVEQILVNLLGNAVKFTPAGGNVRLDCRTVSANGNAARTEFIVEDNGIGIAQDRLQTIFEAFVQAEGGYTREHGGSGLGLTISNRLAAMMGGDISVQSEEGVGSRFTLSLPSPE